MREQVQNAVLDIEGIYSELPDDPGTVKLHYSPDTQCAFRWEMRAEDHEASQEGLDFRFEHLNPARRPATWTVTAAELSKDVQEAASLYYRQALAALEKAIRGMKPLLPQLRNE